MVITYQGEHYFKIQSGELTLLIDPTNQRSYKGAHVIIHTISPAPTLAPEHETEGSVPLWIERQGEYDANDIRVNGWTTEIEKGVERTAYRIRMDEIDIAVLGHITREPDQKIQSALTNADIVIVPAGGKPYITHVIAAKLIRRLEPSIVIPSLYTNDIKPFLKEFGQLKCEPQEKLTIKKKDFIPHAMSVQWITH